MSGAPPPGPTCSECGTQKTMGTEQTTRSSTKKDSKTKNYQAGADSEHSSGTYNSKNSEESGESSGRNSDRNFPICPTAGCGQRKRDRWYKIRWELQNDPNREYTPQTRDQMMARLEEDEKRYAEEINKLTPGFRAKEGGTIKQERSNERKQEEQRYQDKRTKEDTSSRQSARDSSNQSDIQSRHSQDQNAATEWGNTPDNKDIPWSNKQAQASSWGNTEDTDTTAWSNAQASGTTASEQDTAQATDQDSTTETTTTAWGHPRESDTTETTDTASDTDEETSAADTAFEQSVYGDSQMDSQGGTMANESPNGENSDKTNTETETERYNDNRSRNRSR